MDERRRTKRYFFSAQAEVQEPINHVRVNTRVSDLSLTGCYLDMMNPFPPGTVVKLRITSGAETLQTSGRIVYSTPNVGSGAEFADIPSSERALLERWLDQAAK